MSESRILKECLLKATRLGLRLFRNQVGTYKLEDGRVISSGMGKGTSDLVGWTPVVITQDMVGKTLAVFTAVECKAPNGRLTPEQQQFINVVQQAGGLAGVARCADDVAKISIDV